MGETPNCFEETTNSPQTHPSASYAAPFLGRAFRYSALKWRFWGYTAQGFFCRSHCFARKRVSRSATAMTNARTCDP